MTPLPAAELEQIEQRARASQSGRIRPGQVAAIARLSRATREHWSRSRGDVLRLAAEIRRLTETARQVKALPHGPTLVARDRDSLSFWAEHGIPLDDTTVSALLAIALTAVADLDRVHEAVGTLLDSPIRIVDQDAAADLLDLIRRRAGNRAQLIDLAYRAFGGEIR